MAKRFTAVTIDQIKPDPTRRLELPDEVVRGLYFVLQPSGVRSWAFRYRAGGKPAKLTLGAFPALGLAAARAAARVSREAVDRGQDPAAAKSEMKRRRKEGAAAPGSVQRIHDDFVRRYVEKENKPRTAEETKRILRSKVLPAWGSRQLSDITKKDVRQLIEAIEEAGTPIAANRTLAAVRKMFNWAIDRDELDANPCVGVKPVAKEIARNRVLMDLEIKALWGATAALGQPFGQFFRALLLTGQRRTEVAEMRDDEIVGDLWIIPGERTKNHRPNAVPLSKAAQHELAAVDRIGSGGWVFSTTGRTPVSGFANAKDAIDKRMLLYLKAQAESAGKDPAAVALSPWTPHDLRRTLATGMARLRVPRHVTEAILNHAPPKLVETYTVYDYLDEKREALDLWADHVAKIVGEAKPGAAAI